MIKSIKSALYFYTSWCPLLVLTYLVIAYNGVLLEAMTPPIWK